MLLVEYYDINKNFGMISKELNGVNSIQLKTSRSYRNIKFILCKVKWLPNQYNSILNTTKKIYIKYDRILSNSS